MKTIWFKKIGWFYFPASIIGTIITLMLLILLATVIIATNRNAHSVSDMMYGIFPYAVCCFYLVNWVGRNTSE